MSELPAPAYLQCSLCGFWITREQSSCPNCGIGGPGETDWKVFSDPVGGAGVTVIGLVGVVSALAAAGAVSLLHVLAPGSGIAQDLMEWRTLISAGSGVALAGGLASIVGYYRHRFKRPRPRDCFQKIEESLKAKLDPPESLQRTAHQLAERITELQQRGEDATSLQKAHSTVQEALSVSALQSRSARIMLEKIVMLRWQNTLEPLILEPHAMSAEEWKQRLERLDAIQSEGRKLVSEFDMKSDLITLIEGLELRQIWTELLEGCERLENELLARQAVAAVESAKMKEDESIEGSELPAQMALRHVLITHDFGDLQSSVKDLRAQEVRLQSERDLTEQQARTVQRN